MADFTDNYGSDWPELVDASNYEENLITSRSKQQSKSIIETNRREYWQCSQCDTYNNVRQCIKIHGSKCAGCHDECYIKFQTETIEHPNQITHSWECESCLIIIHNSILNCSECNQPSPMTIIRRNIKKFTEKQKNERLIHGFVRELSYYFDVFPAVPVALHYLIQTFYYIEYGWIGAVKCMSNTQALNLGVGDTFDHRNGSGKFEVAEITQVDISDDNCKFKIKDEAGSWPWSIYTLSGRWYDYKSNPLKFAEAGAVSARPAHRLKHIKVGDWVDVNPNEATQKYNEWKDGQIKEMDDKSGQVKVEYRSYGIATVFWTHLDNEDEIAEFGSMVGQMKKTITELLMEDVAIQQRVKMDLGNQWLE